MVNNIDKMTNTVIINIVKWNQQPERKGVHDFIKNTLYTEFTSYTYKTITIIIYTTRTINTANTPCIPLIPFILFTNFRLPQNPIIMTSLPTLPTHFWHQYNQANQQPWLIPLGGFFFSELTSQYTDNHKHIKLKSI